MKSYYKRNKKSIDRVVIVGIFVCLFAVAIVVKLFFLQILDHKTYQALAEGQQVSTTIDPATRGKIYMKADQSGDYIPVATNVPLDMLYVDPNPYNNKEFDDYIDGALVAQQISPIVLEHFCQIRVYNVDKESTCAERVSEFTKLPEMKMEMVTIGDEDKSLELAKKEEDLIKDIQKVITDKLSVKEVVFVPLQYTRDEELISKVKDLNLQGIYTGEGIIYGNPTEVYRDGGQKLLQDYKKLADTLSISVDDLNYNLRRRISRYSLITRRMHPDLSDKIAALREKEIKCPIFYSNPEKVEGLTDQNDPICRGIRVNVDGKPIRNFFGVVLKQENWRYYPEEALAAPVIGFMNFEKEGNYGVEEEYDNQLRGNDGQVTIESDPMGRLIASNLKVENIKMKENGIDIYLTIDRVVQRKVEQALEQKVKDTKANSGQVIVMDPYTGKIISLAQYPSYNPNAYSDVYDMKPTFVDPGKGIPMFIKNEKGEYENVPEYDRANIPNNVDTYVYENRHGPGAYYNHAVQGVYEPGSIFKPLIIAAGIDSGEITPQTTYVDRGELKVDEFTIRNVSEKCLGTRNMINVLNHSCNIGMSFIAGRLGKALIHKYITDFGFGTRTDIELPDESKGKIFPFEEWSTARLYNTAFGQGLTVTPLQMAQAYSVLANGGLLVSPQVVEKVVYNDGRVVEKDRTVIKRVISKETADTISAMLTSVAENGGSKPARIEGYYIAGKTGTAQIASSRGGYEEDGVGATIGSFAGYLPADKPQFVIITKVDRPRTTKWADQSAAPLFKEIGEFLVDYYHIPPER